MPARTVNVNDGYTPPFDPRPEPNPDEETRIYYLWFIEDETQDDDYWLIPAYTPEQAQATFDKMVADWWWWSEDDQHGEWSKPKAVLDLTFGEIAYMEDGEQLNFEDDIRPKDQWGKRE